VKSVPPHVVPVLPRRLVVVVVVVDVVTIMIVVVVVVVMMIMIVIVVIHVVVVTIGMRTKRKLRKSLSGKRRCFVVVRFENELTTQLPFFFVLEISQLQPEIVAEDLKKLFSQFGTVTDAMIQMDRVTNRSRGFGFVVFADEKSVDSCVGSRELHLAGRRLEVKRAVTRERMRGMY
jgi:hypothetical protein